MDTTSIEVLGERAIALMALSIFLVLAFLAGLIFLSWYLGRRRGSLSPYSKKPMNFAVDLAGSVARQIQEYLESMPQPENEPFDIAYAAYCPETRRIFPNCVKRGEFVRLDWTFLEKRYPGKYVSWGSLNEMQKATLKLCHGTIEGYQLEHSCPRSLPQEIDPSYALRTPGPLYVDLAKKILLGWKRVPGTDFEVLVVQLPVFDTIEDTL